MGVVVIGGQASGVGKTSVICGLIAATPERRWTAVKITQCSHGDNAEKPCDCELDGRQFVITEEQDRTVRTDTSRYLAAGAVCAQWVRTLPGNLGEALSRIEEVIARADDVVIESNSVMEFLRPEVYALVASPAGADFKVSALRYADLADAILVAEVPKSGKLQLPVEVGSKLNLALRFSLDARYVSPEFFAFVLKRLS